MRFGWTSYVSKPTSCHLCPRTHFSFFLIRIHTHLLVRQNLLYFWPIKTYFISGPQLLSCQNLQLSLVNSYYFTLSLVNSYFLSDAGDA